MLLSTSLLLINLNSGILYDPLELLPLGNELDLLSIAVILPSLPLFQFLKFVTPSGSNVAAWHPACMQAGSGNCIFNCLHILSSCKPSLASSRYFPTSPILPLSNELGQLSVPVLLPSFLSVPKFVTWSYSGVVAWHPACMYAGSGNCLFNPDSLLSQLAPTAAHSQRDHP